MRVGIIGCGALGSVIVEAICRGEVRAELVALMDMYPDKCRTLLETRCPESATQTTVCGNLECLLDSKPQLVVEVASQKAVEEYVPKVLAQGVSVIVLSVGSLLKDSTYRAVVEASKLGRARVYIPTGAIAGLDAVKALANVGIKRVVVRTYKNVKAFDPRVLRELGFGEIKGVTKIFEGRGDVAVSLFPANTNIIAALALASGRTPWVEIYADPELARNVHEIEVESEASTVRIRVENTPHPQNPRTSYLAALSALQLLKQLTSEEAVAIGT